ncbi:hypothetical protein U1Q18_039553 [Sarracenia purpurea var. burkii]
MWKGANLSRGVLLMLILLCLKSGLLPAGNAIWLNLSVTGTKCVLEEIQNNVVVLADYVVISEDYTHPSPSILVNGEQPRDGVFLEENLYGAGWAGEKGEVRGSTAEPSTGVE